MTNEHDHATPTVLPLSNDVLQEPRSWKQSTTDSDFEGLLHSTRTLHSTASPSDLPRQDATSATPSQELLGQAIALSQELPGQAAAAQHPGRPRTRAQNNFFTPKVYKDGTLRYAYSSSTEPGSLDQALGDPNWKCAMDEEYSALMRNRNCRLLPPESGQNNIDCKWVYKIKKKADGSIN